MELQEQLVLMVRVVRMEVVMEVLVLLVLDLQDRLEVQVDLLEEDPLEEQAVQLLLVLRIMVLQEQQELEEMAAAAAAAEQVETDRKSTRLNSSHITISYAVFCL